MQPLLALLVAALLAPSACRGGGPPVSPAAPPESAPLDQPQSAETAAGEAPTPDAQADIQAGVQAQAGGQAEAQAGGQAEAEAGGQAEAQVGGQAEAQAGGQAAAQAQAETPAQTAPAPSDAADSPSEPPPLPASEILLPPGFAAFRWAEGLVEPTALAFSADGRLFAAERGGRVLTFRDADGNGQAEAPVVFAEGLNELLGIAVASSTRVYLSDRGRVSAAEDDDGDGVADRIMPLLRDLPVGRHQNNGLALGPDGRLYLTLGSTCNECLEASPFSASILVYDFATGLLTVYASGLRNAYDLVFTPDGELWATDNGSDPDCATPDELNRIRPETHYGWPYCLDETAPFASEQAPVLDLGFHTSADGLIWFESDLYPPSLSGGFYIALWGASTGELEIGRSVVFAKREGGSLTLETFATGFDRPLDIAAGPDANLYVADFGRGVIYRIGALPE